MLNGTHGYFTAIQTDVTSIVDIILSIYAQSLSTQQLRSGSQCSFVILCFYFILFDDNRSIILSLQSFNNIQFGEAIVYYHPFIIISL